MTYLAKRFTAAMVVSILAPLLSGSECNRAAADRGDTYRGRMGNYQCVQTGLKTFAWRITDTRKPGVESALQRAEYTLSNPCLKQSIAIAHDNGELVIWHIHEAGGYVDELIRLKANGTVTGNVAMALSTIDIVSAVRKCQEEMEGRQ